MIKPESLSAEVFAPFGQVIEMRGDFDFRFNDGRADRWHDLAKLEVDEAGRMGVSLGVSRPVDMPYAVEFVERHPLASQAFIPLDERPFLVIVAVDRDGRAQSPRAFLSNGKQGVNYARGVWHGVLAPLGAPQKFVMIDRVEGDGDNIEIFRYDEAQIIDCSNTPTDI